MLTIEVVLHTRCGPEIKHDSACTKVTWQQRTRSFGRVAIAQIGNDGQSRTFVWQSPR